MITAYDTPPHADPDAAGVDVILVGDSVANVVLGYEDTLQVTVATWPTTSRRSPVPDRGRSSSPTCRG